MGGKGSGGRRPRAGRPRKSAAEHAVTGDAGRRGRVLPHTSAPAAPEPPVVVEEFDAPDTLTMEQRHVWLRQAPHAFRKGTLTKAEALSFERYCQVVVAEQDEAKSTARGGANHRGLLKMINTYELQFRLTADGKPSAVPGDVKKPVNPLERFMQRA